MTSRLRNTPAWMVCLLLVLWSVAAGQTDVQGDIVSRLQTIRNAMPGMGSNKFIIPTNTQLADFTNVFSMMDAGEFSSIQSVVGTYGYTLYRWYNTTTRDTLYVLQENIPVQRGWGTYIFNPAGSVDFCVEVPHPIWDTNTWKMGAWLFLQARARWYFVSGTHRYANTDSSSDMAHVTQSVFYTAHRIIGSATACQVHGFDRSDAQYQGYPQVVISNGTQYPPGNLYTLQTNYTNRGITAGVYSTATKSSLGQLGATTNTEGKWSASHGKAFVHCEHDYPIRTDSATMQLAVDALRSTFGPPTGILPSASGPERFTLGQNYPNPFNPTTSVAFVISSAPGGSSFVTLTIYDALGREVMVLTKEMMEAGEHTVQWDASGMPSGVYFYRMSATGNGKSFSAVRSMVLVR
jgi:hypothetical protein